MKKILVIEDDTNITQSIFDFLEAEEFDVYTCSDGISGIKAAQKFKPDLIICDIAMPGKNGYDVLEALSGDDKTAGIPFIFLSAKVEKDDIRLGMELGADDYLTKPFKLDELLRAVESRLKKKERIKFISPAITSPGQKDYNESDRIMLNIKNKPRFIKLSDIVYITAEAEYSYIFTADGEKNIVRKLLKEWEYLLPSNSFSRIHRSTLINLNFIQRIERSFNYSYYVFIKNRQEPLILSRRYALLLKKKYAR